MAKKTKPKVKSKSTRQPKSAQAQETIRIILLASKKIVLAEGVDALNTNLLAQKAGVSVGSIYQYFSNKDEILRSLLLSVLEKRTQRVKEAISISLMIKSTEKIVDKLVEALFESDDSEEAKLELLLLPLAISTHSQASQDLVANNEQSMGPIIKMLLTAKEPKLKNRDLEVVAFLITQAIRGAALGRSLPKGRNLELSEIKKELKKLILGFVRYSES